MQWVYLKVSSISEARRVRGSEKLKMDRICVAAQTNVSTTQLLRLLKSLLGAGKLQLLCHSRRTLMWKLIRVTHEMSSLLGSDIDSGICTKQQCGQPAALYLVRD